MKYYAVARGERVGVYTTWAECQEQVKGFKGAKYKSFKTLAEAESYVRDCDAFDAVTSEFKRVYTVEESVKVFATLNEGVAFVGGKYDVDTGSYAYSYVLVTNGQIYTEVGAGDLLSVQKLAFVGVEILGMSHLVVKARELGVKDLTIYHKTDYLGVWFEKGYRSDNVDVKKFLKLLDKIHANSTTLHLLKLEKKSNYGLYIKAKGMAELELEKFKGEY